MSPHWEAQQIQGQTASMAMYNMWAHCFCFWISELFHPIMFAFPLGLFIMGRHTGSFYESSKTLAPTKALFRGVPKRALAFPMATVALSGVAVHQYKKGLLDYNILD